MLSLAAAASLIAVATAQQVGTYQTETHPTLSWQQCTSSGCTTVSGSIVLDSNWRWVHQTGTYTNCYTGNAWNTTICSSATTCASNCALEGADYSSTYGITTSGNSLKLNFVTQNGNSGGPNVGSRVYLLASSSKYQTFNLLNREFTFTVDTSNLDCGLNGAVYFSQMDADGGTGRYPANKAGAAYGTGYCDSQCPRDLKFINGVANTVNWTGTDSNSGTGNTGTCCTEMDIWEANKWDNAVTPHPCTVTSQTACTGTNCQGTLTTGYCDPAGCDFNPYRMGVTNFFGPGLTVDSSKPVTVVTQFITSDGTDTGTLSAIRRFYVQNNKVIAQPAATNINDATADISDAFCAAQKTAFSDDNIFKSKGGLAQMGKMSTAMVLVLSLWDDHTANMLWLDSNYPTNRPASQAGTVRGSCATTSGDPTTVESQDASASVTYSNIKFGTINSTFSANGGGGGTTTGGGGGTTTHTTTTGGGGGGSCSPLYGQCGGIGYTGATCCAQGTCKVGNPYYSQCLS